MVLLVAVAVEKVDEEIIEVGGVSSLVEDCVGADNGSDEPNLSDTDGLTVARPVELLQEKVLKLLEEDDEVGKVPLVSVVVRSGVLVTASFEVSDGLALLLLEDLLLREEEVDSSFSEALVDDAAVGFAVDLGVAFDVLDFDFLVEVGAFVELGALVFDVLVVFDFLVLLAGFGSSTTSPVFAAAGPNAIHVEKRFHSLVW
jgi:hypothetical protein